MPKEASSLERSHTAFLESFSIHFKVLKQFGRLYNLQK